MSEIDYRQEDMEASNRWAGSALGKAYVAGWRAALEAAHAKAKADEGQPQHAGVKFRTIGLGRATGDGKIEMVAGVKFWASEEHGGYFEECANFYCFYDRDGGGVSEIHKGEARNMILAGGYIPCHTEAEARRVAGFPDA